MTESPGRHFRVFIALILSSGLSGCAIIHAQSRIDPRTVANYGELNSKAETCYSDRLDDDANAGAVNLDCAKFPDRNGNNDPTAYKLAAIGGLGTDATEANRVYFRNRLAGLLMKHADDVCIASLGRATNNEALSNVVLNTLTTSLASASTVVSGELAKSILSAGAATASGTRDHVNAGIFRNTLVSAVTKAISNERERQSLAIEQKLIEPSARYVDMMIRDVNRYHQACSFNKGLEMVVRAVDRTTVDQSDRVSALDEAIQALKREMAANSKTASARQGRLDQLIALRASAAANPDSPASKGAAGSGAA